MEVHGLHPHRTVLVMSADPAVREGWARYFENRGLGVIRCAGPEAAHCALALGPHCPLHDEADAAYYENASVTEELAVDLIKRPRLLPIFFANDRLTAEGQHEPEVSRSI